MRKINEETYENAVDYGKSKYVWFGEIYDGWPDEDRACVPMQILRLADGVLGVKHGMNHPCTCSKNSDKTVVCYADTARGYFKTYHKPGRCPFLVYGPKTVDDPADYEKE